MKETGEQEVLEEVREIIKTHTSDPYEIFHVKKASELIESKDEMIDGYETALAEGVAIRIHSDQKMGFGFTTRLDTDGIRSMVQKAIEALKVSIEDSAYGFLDPSVPYPSLTLHDPALLTLTAEAKRDLAITVERAARDYDERIKQVRNAQFTIREASVRLFNSLGLDRAYQATVASANIMLTAEDAGGAEYGWESVSSHFLANISPEEIGRRAAAKAVSRLGGRTVPSGTYPAILDQEVVAEIIGLLSTSFTGENVYKGKSALTDKVGQAAFSRHLSLYDGLLFEEGLAAAPFDGEGEPGRETPLIEQGIVAGFLYDHYYGRKAGQPSTANSVRAGVSTPPTCGTTNLYVAPGDSSFDDMVAGISKGFLVQELMGVHTANPITGEFSLGASGQWIENGALTFPVRGVAVSGNLFEILNRVEEVSQELRWFGTIGTPYLLIGALSVAGS